MARETPGRGTTILAEMAVHLRETGGPTTPTERLYLLFQEAIESATGARGLRGYVPMSESGDTAEAIQENAGSLAIAAAIAYAGADIAESIARLAEGIDKAAADITEAIAEARDDG